MFGKNVLKLPASSLGSEPIYSWAWSSLICGVKSPLPHWSLRVTGGRKFHDSSINDKLIDRNNVTNKDDEILGFRFMIHLLSPRKSPLWSENASNVWGLARIDDGCIKVYNVQLSVYANGTMGICWVMAVECPQNLIIFQTPGIHWKLLRWRYMNQFHTCLPNSSIMGSYEREYSFLSFPQVPLNVRPAFVNIEDPPV